MKNPVHLLAGALLAVAACGDGDDRAEPPQYFFTQTSHGALLEDSTLTLFRVSGQTGWFTDRPSRKAGQILTEEFLSLWGDGENSFADEPPNADFTCTIDGEVVNYVVELSSPSYVPDRPGVFCESCPVLTYDVRPVGDAAPFLESAYCTGDAHLFIEGFDPL